MSKELKLKLCPFCGKTPKIIMIKNYHIVACGHYQNKECGIEIIKTAPYRTLWIAKEKWNRRQNRPCHRSEIALRQSTAGTESDCYVTEAIEALAELSKPKCKTCNDTHQVGEEEFLHGRSMGYKACPDCENKKGGE